MKRRIAILQPGYLPWLGYFDQLARVDLFVHYDDVQYTRRDWRNRNRIKGPGGPQWLTVPVAVKGRYDVLIRDVPIADADWTRLHLATLRHCYARAPHFDLVYPRLEAWLTRPWERLADLCIAGVELLAGLLRITTPTVRSSTVPGCDGLHKTDRLLAVCRALGATDYLSGAAARDYLDVAAFERSGIAVTFQDYAHPVYPQLWGDFVSHLSVVDLLMNVGPDARALLPGTATPTTEVLVG